MKWSSPSKGKRVGVRLGLDLGEKRVGVALTDEAGIMALPYLTLEIRGRKHLVEELQKIIASHRVGEVVVGLPLTLKGEIGPAAQRIQETVEWCRPHFSIPWVFWDERLTSLEVERLLQEADLHHTRRKEVRDQLAAQRILQNFLDFHRVRP